MSASPGPTLPSPDGGVGLVATRACTYFSAAGRPPGGGLRMLKDLDEDTYPPASILVVDDNPANLIALSAVLDRLGHRVVQARSGAAACAHVAEEEFAVILLDVQMPIMDGFQTLQRLSQLPNGRQAPV